MGQDYSPLLTRQTHASHEKLLGKTVMKINAKSEHSAASRVVPIVYAMIAFNTESVLGRYPARRRWRRKTSDNARLRSVTSITPFIIFSLVALYFDASCEKRWACKMLS